MSAIRYHLFWWRPLPYQNVSRMKFFVVFLISTIRADYITLDGYSQPGLNPSVSTNYAYADDHIFAGLIKDSGTAYLEDIPDDPMQTDFTL